jgi:NADPH:quinone reductase-like Zn-dependent oxidoreductase
MTGLFRPKHRILGMELAGEVEGVGPAVNEFAVGQHGVGIDEETTDAQVAYARFPEPEPTRYRDAWLP